MHTLQEILTEPQTMYNGGLVAMQDGGDLGDPFKKLRAKTTYLKKILESMPQFTDEIPMQDGGFVLETYVNPETRSEMKIPHMGNVPSWPVPPGFMLKSEITDQLIAVDPPAPGGLEAVEGDEIGDIPGWDKEPVDFAIDDLNAQLDRGVPPDQLDLTDAMSKHGVTQSQIHNRLELTEYALMFAPVVTPVPKFLSTLFTMATKFLTPGLTADMVGMGVTSGGPGGAYGMGPDPDWGAGDPGKGFDDYTDTPADEVGAGPHGVHGGLPGTPADPTQNFISWNPMDPVGKGDAAADTASEAESSFDSASEGWRQGGLVRPMYDGGPVSMQDGGDPDESVTAGDVVSTTPDSPETLASFTPILGDILDIKEFYEAATKEGGPDYAGMGIAALGLVPFVGDVAQAGIRGARTAFKTIDEVPKAKLVDETLSAEELSKKVSVKTGDFAAPRKPELQKAVTKLETGEITGKQYRQLVKKELPINPITEVPKLDSFEQISAALTKDKRARGLVGFNRNIKQGARVLSRLDIPAYNNHDTWVVTLTDKSQNVRTMYGKTAVLKNVKFSPHTTPSLKVAKGKAKEPFATMEGDWQNISPEDARKYVIDNKILEKSLDPNNKAWVQIGFNPERHGFFYTKSGKEIGQPIFDADEIIQIGGLVLARNIKKPNLTQLKKLKIKGVSRVFNKGGQIRPMYDGGLV
jgi:hypothetical protein